jgi:hypothetical protein
MAYVSQELKAKLAPRIREICKKYGVKASLAVERHSTLALNVKSGAIDFIGNFNQNAVQPRWAQHLPHHPVTTNLSVNTHWFQNHFSDAALAFLDEIIPALKGPDYFDESDVQSDYFHLSHYIAVNVGRWNKPYILESTGAL